MDWGQENFSLAIPKCSKIQVGSRGWFKYRNMWATAATRLMMTLNEDSIFVSH